MAPATLVVLVAGGCSSSDSPGVRSSAGRILVLGDSLAVSPTPGSGFPQVLQKRLKEAGLSWTVVNAGVRGDTTGGGLRRIDALLAASRPNILVLALGANDGLRRLDVSQMSRNLEAIILKAKAQDTQVLLCGLDLPGIGVLGYGRSYRNAFSDLARKHDVPFVPFLLEGVALNRDMNLPDGMHPNTAGAQRIAETIWPSLERMLRSGAPVR